MKHPRTAALALMLCSAMAFAEKMPDGGTPPNHVLAPLSFGSIPVLGTANFENQRAKLFLANPAVAAKLLREHFVDLQTGPDFLIVRLGPPHTKLSPLRDEDRQRYTSPSFLIDYDDKAFTPFWAAVQKKLGPTLPESRLAEGATIVHDHIHQKNLRRLYDLASQVATRREGDCSEHAVLLTALLRAYGWPARVVHGLLLFKSADSLRGFGHAWTEAYTKKGWQALDATLPPESLHPTYLPLYTLSDESITYMTALTGALQQSLPQHVEFLADAPHRP